MVKQGKKRKKWQREKENVGTRTQTVGINKRWMVSMPRPYRQPLIVWILGHAEGGSSV